MFLEVIFFRMGYKIGLPKMKPFKESLHSFAY
jgi:hypothetical protein